MKKLHLAIGVSDIAQSVADYTRRLEKEADLVIPGHYALWRTETLNVSIRKVTAEESGKLRHLGWENPEVTEFTSDHDCNQILWEEFTAEQQADEIEQAWPGTSYIPQIL